MAEENVESVQPTESEETPTESTESVLTAETTEEQPEEVSSVLTEEPKADEPKESVPDSYELKVPEGAPLQQAHIDKIAAFAKERGLSNEQAQALVDRDNAMAAEAQQEHKTLVQEHYASVLADAKADPEIGGDKWGETVQKAQRFLNALGDTDLKRMFHDNPDISNNKAVLRFMRRGFERFMAEDSLTTGESAETKRPLKNHEVLYGEEQ